MSITEVPPATLQLLGRYDTPTVCNVIELFAVRPRTAGYMDARIRACFPEMPPMVGYASTATYRGALEREQGSSYATLDEQIKAFADLPGPPIVVFQDLDDPPVSATFGEVMCSTYQAFGSAGLITSGAARDLDQVRRIGFPVFAGGIICSHGYSHFTSIHQPVRIGGIAVRPGDLLHADVNGVTTIPHEIASDVAAACEEYMACEAVILDHLKAGSKDVRAYSEARQECMRRIGELGMKVRSRSAQA